MSSERVENYDRFKYAEERAHDLDGMNNHTWRMWRADDRIETETYPDGSTETYTVPQYMVAWRE